MLGIVVGPYFLIYDLYHRPATCHFPHGRSAAWLAGYVVQGQHTAEIHLPNTMMNLKRSPLLSIKRL